MLTTQIGESQYSSPERKLIKFAPTSRVFRIDDTDSDRKTPALSAAYWRKHKVPTRTAHIFH